MKTPDLRVFACLGGSLLVVSFANAVPLTWDAGGGGGAITNGGGAWLGTGLWNNGGVAATWTSGDDAIFAGPATAGGPVTLASPTVVGSLTFNPSFTGTYTLGTAGQSITLNSGITKNAGSGTVSIISPIVLGGSQTWTNNSATSLNTTGTVNLGSNTLTFGGSGNFSFAVTGASTISGAGGNIIKDGTGLLTLSGGGTAQTHTYTGTTTINGGTVMLGGGNKSAGNFNLNGGMLTDYFQSSYTFSGGLGAGNNQIRITGASGFGGGNGNSNWTIGSANSVLTWGGTHFNPTALKFLASGVDNMGTSTFGQVTLNNGLNLGGVARTIDVAPATGSNALSSSKGTITGVISNGTLNKTGGGNLQLNGANTYSGGTTITNGMVRFNAKTAMPNAGAVSVSSGATLGVLVNNGGTGWGGGAGNGGIAGLTNGLGGQAGGTVSFAAGNSSLFLDVTADTTESNVISNGGATNLSLIKFGTSALTLSNSNTFTGGVTIGAGTLRLQNINAIGTASGVTAFTGTTLQLRSDTAATFVTPLTTLDTTGTSSMTINGDRISSGSGNQLTLNGGISSNQLHGNETTFNLTGGNGYTLSVPTLAISRSGAGGAGGGTILNASTDVAIGSATLNSTQNLFLRLTGTSTGNTMGAMTQASGTFSLQKQGAGTWRLTGSNSYSGTTNLSGGTLEVAVMANGGSNSGVGRSSNAANQLLLGDGTTLRYVGTANATTDRAFTINGTAAGHGATIESSGTGTLSFSGGPVLAYGITAQTRTLTLGGTNTGANTFGKVLADNGTGATSLVKSGVGTWVLSQANTYTGTTAVDNGTLLINGSTSTSSVVTVGVNGTLGGTGTVGGATTINGTLAPGQSPGVMTFANTLALAGSTVMEIDGMAGAGVAGGHDFVNLTGSGASGVLTYGGTMTVDIGVLFGEGSYSWNLFDFASETGTFTGISLADQYSGSLTNGGMGVWGLTDGDNTWTFTESTGVFGLVVVPEPSTALLGVLGFLVLLRRRR